MRDPLDDTLAEAGEFLRNDKDVDAALGALVEARVVDDAAVKPRRAPKIAPVVAIGVALAVASGGAVAATQWGPWTYVSESETDLVVSREWTDVNGTYLGSCETRLSTDVLPADARELALGYLTTVDVDAIEPDPEWVAGLLNALGRIDDVGQLVPGAVPSDFDNGPGGNWTGPAVEYFSDARVLHQALSQEVYIGMADVLIERMPDFNYGWSDIQARLETKCTTDPGYAGDR